MYYVQEQLENDIPMQEVLSTHKDLLEKLLVLNNN